MTIAELHKAIRSIVPRDKTVSVHVETQESQRGLNVEFKAFVHDSLCHMFEGDSCEAVYEQVKARYTTQTADQMAALDTDMSELEAA